MARVLLTCSWAQLGYAWCPRLSCNREASSHMSQVPHADRPGMVSNWHV